MSPELKQLCIIVAVSAPVGLAVGLLLRKKKPDWCKSYAKSCLDRKWRLFLAGLILFIGLSVASFVGDRPYFGLFFLAFALLEAFCLAKYGFRPLTPELEAKIDASDPTRIFSKAASKQRTEQDAAPKPCPAVELKAMRRSNHQSAIHARPQVRVG